MGSREILPEQVKLLVGESIDFENAPVNKTHMQYMHVALTRDHKIIQNFIQIHRYIQKNYRWDHESISSSSRNNCSARRRNLRRPRSSTVMERVYGRKYLLRVLNGPSLSPRLIRSLVGWRLWDWRLMLVIWALFRRISRIALIRHWKVSSM